MRTILTQLDRPDNGLMLLAQEQIHVGVDVHKADYKVHLWSGQRQLCVAAWVQPPEPPALVKSLDPIRGHVARIVYEAGPTGYGLCRQLRQAGLPADVIAPSRTPQSTSPTAKCDRLDARKLAMYSAKGLLAPVAVPTEQEQVDRQKGPPPRGTNGPYPYRHRGSRPAPRHAYFIAARRRWTTTKRTG